MERNKRTDERTNERFTSFLPPLLPFSYPPEDEDEGRQAELLNFYFSIARAHPRSSRRFYYFHTDRRRREDEKRSIITDIQVPSSIFQFISACR